MHVDACAQLYAYMRTLTDTGTHARTHTHTRTYTFVYDIDLQHIGNELYADFMCQSDSSLWQVEIHIKWVLHSEFWWPYLGLLKP